MLARRRVHGTRLRPEPLSHEAGHAWSIPKAVGAVLEPSGRWLPPWRVHWRSQIYLGAGMGKQLRTTPTTTGVGTELLQKELQGLLAIIARNNPPPKNIRIEDVRMELTRISQRQCSLNCCLAWPGGSQVQPWALLSNTTGEPFLTSDNPSAAFGQDNLGSTARTLPLSPDMCISTMMDFNLVVPTDYNLMNLTRRPCGRTTLEAATLEQARFVNSLIVKHAGNLVFSSRADADVGALVAMLSKYGVRLDHTAMSLEETKAVLSIAKTGIGPVR